MRIKMKQFLLLMLGLTFLGSFQATAHTRLSAATPADSAVVKSSPVEIVLEFNGKVRLLTVNLESSNAQIVELGELPQTVAERFALPVPESLPPGDYIVSWRAVGADTHPVSGQIHFSVAA
jgi:methionine-rich copper-binding protein CopC